MSTHAAVGTSRGLVLAAMIFAVAMTFIDQTIVSIAAPKIQSELGLSSTGIQWAINSYLLALAALFAFGGRLADTIGHRPMVIIGITVFAVASALCGLTPKGAFAEAWLVTFRAVQGLGGALMYPAALAIVVNTYEVKERGRALAQFFGIAGGLTAVGPALGGYLTIWTWRAIFWVNIPVAIIALVLVAVSKPGTERRPAPLDVRGLLLVAVGVPLSVFGLQQSARWGWSNPLTTLCIAAGVILLVVFARVERRTAAPLIDLTVFRDRVFLVHNVILAIAMMAFVPAFFFASEYSQIALGESASQASLTLLYFFAGFVVAAQVGGRMLGQANPAALNQVPSTAYGEATGITQTIRNYGSSLGLAILGTVLVTVFQSRIASSLIAQGLPSGQAHHEATAISQFSGGKGTTATIPHFIQVDFADATRVVLFVMAGVMALAFLVAARGLPRRAAVVSAG